MENAGRNLAEMAPECFGEEGNRARIVVLAGTGGNGGGAFAELIHWANSTGASIISLDVPSGLDSTTGATPGEFIRPSWTMTLALPKSGLARAEVGELILADIGIPEETYRRIGAPYVSPFGNRFRVPLSIHSEPELSAAAEVLHQAPRRQN